MTISAIMLKAAIIQSTKVNGGRDSELLLPDKFFIEVVSSISSGSIFSIQRFYNFREGLLGKIRAGVSIVVDVESLFD